MQRSLCRTRSPSSSLFSSTAVYTIWVIDRKQTASQKDEMKSQHNIHITLTHKAKQHTAAVVRSCVVTVTQSRIFRPLCCAHNPPHSTALARQTTTPAHKRDTTSKYIQTYSRFYSRIAKQTLCTRPARRHQTSYRCGQLWPPQTPHKQSSPPRSSALCPCHTRRDEIWHNLSSTHTHGAHAIFPCRTARRVSRKLNLISCGPTQSISDRAASSTS